MFDSFRKTERGSLLRINSRGAPTWTPLRRSVTVQRTGWPRPAPERAGARSAPGRTLGAGGAESHAIFASTAQAAAAFTNVLFMTILSH